LFFERKSTMYRQLPIVAVARLPVARGGGRVKLSKLRQQGKFKVQDEPSQKKRPRRKHHFLLRIDSWIDSTVWNAGFAAGEMWEEITIFFRRRSGCTAGSAPYSRLRRRGHDASGPPAAC